ncbi:MAG TPA: sodium:proton antiporter [Steroidobacteraceae bacterium]|nr:sodium:proton antiporter [Steroidobacteraceae bacterium]
MSAELLQIGLLLFVAALVAMLSRRLHLPYTIGLVLAGIGLYFSPVRIELQLSKELIYSVFLPPLVFEAALYMHWPELKRNLPVVGVLATFGLALAAAVTAAGMHYAVGWPWASAVLFGVLIAATDPVSVIATFKEAGVHGRLRILVEAESLLNDGTAAVAFTAALAMASGGGAGGLAAAGGAGGWIALAGSLLWTIGGGIVCGASAGFALMLLAGRTRDHLVEITFSTLTAYGSFMLAEHWHFSGVLAAMTAGLVTGNFRGSKGLSPHGRAAVEAFWEYAGFVINSLIFLLIGSREAELRFADLWAPVAAAVVLVTLGRALAIYPPCALFAATRLRVDIKQQHVLFWGGLRGALALALALELPDKLPFHDDIVTVAFAVVAFSIFVQGLTMTPLLRKLGQLSERGAQPSAANR